MRGLALRTVAGVLLAVLYVPAHAVEVLRWERLPLAIPLVVGQERVIFIDRNVRVGVPAEVGDRLRVQSAGGAIYLRASQAIPSTRVQLQDAESGALILLDVTAESAKDGQAPLEPVRIVDARMLPKHYGDESARESNAGDTSVGPSTSQRETPIAVVLTRYAAQNLYAPLRTVEPVSGIRRMNVRRNAPLDTLLPTLPVRAKALAAWRLEDQWVTAVRLTNTSRRWLDLDPRTLLGDFVAASFQHPTLGPAGQSTDTTVVYLVTRGHDLKASLLPALSPIDAAANLPPAGATGAARDEK